MGLAFREIGGEHMLVEVQPWPAAHDEVLRLRAKGLSNDEIAHLLYQDGYTTPTGLSYWNASTVWKIHKGYAFGGLGKDLTQKPLRGYNLQNSGGNKHGTDRPRALQDRQPHSQEPPVPEHP